MKFHIIESGYFKLDGGAMFGVVPKQIWDNLNPADDNNMCTWSMRCLLVESGSDLILVDTGLGLKQSEKFRSHFEPHGPYDLESSIQKAGFTVNDITDVFLTHLHFDHCGGSLNLGEDGSIIPAFPNAKYWSNHEHYEWAIQPNAREKASFLKENFVPLNDQGLLEFIDVEQDVPWKQNISIKFFNGHTKAMMVPVFEYAASKRLIYCADLLPSIHHARMPYVMAYDVFPIITLTEKKAFYKEVMEYEGQTTLFFEHDKDHIIGELHKNEKGRFSVIPKEWSTFNQITI